MVNERTPHLYSRRRWLVRLIAISIVIYLAWCLALYFTQDSLLFMPKYAGSATPEAMIDRNIIREWVEIDGGHRVEAWLRVPAAANAGEAAERSELLDGATSQRLPLVVFFHGNAETIDQQDVLAKSYLQRGFAVLMPEYRGYGRSAGKPGQQAIVEDVLAFIERLSARADIDRSRIILHGRSLGGGVAAQVAARLSNAGHPPAALILESTFTSVNSFAASYGVPTFLVKNPFRTDRVLAGEFNGPVLLLHGREDTTIPATHAERLFKILQDNRANQGVKTLSIQTGGHNDFPRDDKSYWETMDAFLSALKLVP